MLDRKNFRVFFLLLLILKETLKHLDFNLIFFKMLAALRKQQGYHLTNRILQIHLEPSNPFRSFTSCRIPQLLRKTSVVQSINRKYHKQVKPFKVHVNFKRTSLPDAKEGSYGSRFCPLSTIEVAEERIKEALSSHRLYTNDEWAEVKNNLMDELPILTETNFSSILMNCLLTLNKVDEAHALMTYLAYANVEINFLAHLKYMDLCAKNVDICGQEVILRSFKKVKPFMDATPVMDLKTAEHLIVGLCATDKWKLALAYLKMVPNYLNMTIKNSIVCAAIRNSDEKLAWDFLNRLNRPENRPSNQVFQELFLYAVRLGVKSGRKSEEFLKKVLEYIRQREIVVGEDVAKVIKEVFECNSNNWKISYAKVSRDGTCESCSKSLRIVGFSAEDFVSLKNSFLEKSIKKSDLFINTTEKEFDAYIKFVNNHKPFDIVLDGLNAAHTFQGKKNPQILASQLLKVVDALAEPSVRILVLGKYHMKSWPSSIMQKITRKARLFLTSNISQDDPFMVYAALLSGPCSNIVSSDLMRDHMSRLDDPLLIQNFKKWQQTHQIYLVVGDNNEPELVKPLQYSINVQGSMEQGWHIPFDDGVALAPYEELNNWLCIQKIE
ncbi:hypothetical protein JTE90_025298 [Oedothorax gibbosus]|uniref:Mitochondrial ribonuclease P catalytic subunit n=1 Tax=Oedothorax gibbosus TaxID=931172 RepID=A0AAV6V757_9ARAC|nr:hypothetical protein JTE90_025298 [Oedothorax gibbosus]